jgi:pyruvate/2-oxoglutarate dehydrogenase complex dihydrolipoamide dehydrogenase (E3) component
MSESAAHPGDGAREDSEDDALLLANVRPHDWQTPRPNGPYPLLVIGGGPAGMAAAYEAALLGAKVALIERHRLGGNSLNYGSVPSKAALRTGRFYAEMRNAELYGASVPTPAEPDVSKVLGRARRMRQRISQVYSAQKLKAAGIDIYFGTARFTGPDRVDVDGVELRFRKAMVATGSRPKPVDIPGLVDAGFIDTSTLFRLRGMPRRVLVIGGGANGCEGAQTLARLGVTTIIAMNEPMFLPGEERDSAMMVSDALAADGVEIHLNTTATRVRVENGCKVVDLVNDGETSTVSVDEIFVGLGRDPMVEGLDLERAGIAFDAVRGIHVDDYLRTTNKRVYGAGDVCLEPKFTSIAHASARIVVLNALFLRSRRFSKVTIPWCTYTDPEIAHVGMYVREARERGIPVKTFSVPMHDVDRALVDGEEVGFVKIHVKDGSDKILGATIVARHAGEMINEISLAIVAGVGLGKLSKVLRAYPTQAEAIGHAADRYWATRLTRWRRRIVGWWLNRR